MDRSDVGSWLGGSPPSAAGYPGQRLGLPAGGPGAMAGTGRRVLALAIDWAASMLISGLLVPDPGSTLRSFATLGVFACQVAVFTWLSGGSFGQRIVGIRVVGLDRPLGLPGSLIRTLLVCLAVPPLIWDADGRGLHDRAVGTVVVRA